MELYTNPPPEATVVCVDELGPELAHELSLQLRDGRQTAIASKRLWNIALRPIHKVWVRRAPCE